MGRIAANADKPKGYEPSVAYRFSCNAAELSCRFAGLPGGPGAARLPLVRGRRQAPVRGVGTRRIHCAPGWKGAR